MSRRPGQGKGVWLKPDAFRVEMTPDGGCGVMECGHKPIAAFGMCWAHYRRNLRGLPVHVIIGGTKRHRHAVKFGPARPPYCVLRIGAILRDLATLWTPEPTTGCWLWLGGTFPSGYGRIGNMRDPWGGYAHRAALHFAGVAVPAGHRSHVRHLCDQPACVNPAHLALGSPQENADDRRRGLAWQGWLARLRSGEVTRGRRPCRVLPNGKTYAETAREAGVSICAIRFRAKAGWPAEMLSAPSQKRIAA